MKILKTPYAYILLLFLPILIVSFCLAYFFAPAIVIAVRIFSWIFLLLVLILACSPYGKQRIYYSADSSTYPAWRWLGLLFSLQWSMGLFFLLLAQSMLVLLPVPLDLGGNSAHTAVRHAIHLLNFNSGFYPWPMYLLFSIILAYFAKTSQGVLPLKNTLRPVLKEATDGLIGAGADMFMKQGLFFVCAITVAIGILQISQSIGVWLNIPINSGLYSSNLLLGSFILLLFAARFNRRISHYLWHRQWPLRNFLVVTIVFLAAIVVGFNAIIKILLPYLQHFTMPMLQLPFFDRENWLVHWQLLVIIWWLGWTPLVSYFIARLAHGRMVREIILAGLIAPICFGLLSWKITYYDVPSWPIVLSLTLISLGLVCVFFKDNFLTQLLASVGSGKNIRRRIALSVIRSFLLLVAMMLVIYLLLGIGLITLLAFSVMGVCFVIIGIACVGYCRELLRKNL
jgi:choline-glycine betaine transporter